MTDPVDATGGCNLDKIQRTVIQWQRENFPQCQEWELALGVCEEAGELAQCILKLHRGMRGDEFDEAHLKDAVGDVVIFLMGICEGRNWKLSEVIEETARRVILRNWTKVT